MTIPFTLSICVSQNSMRPGPALALSIPLGPQQCGPKVLDLIEKKLK